MGCGELQTERTTGSTIKKIERSEKTIIIKM